MWQIDFEANCLLQSTDDVADQLRDSVPHAIQLPPFSAFLPRIGVRTGTVVVVVLLLGQDSAPIILSVGLAVPVLLHPEIIGWLG